jgi:hypothetical protein
VILMDDFVVGLHTLNNNMKCLEARAVDDSTACMVAPRRRKGDGAEGWRWCEVEVVRGQRPSADFVFWRSHNVPALAFVLFGALRGGLGVIRRVALAVMLAADGRALDDQVLERRRSVAGGGERPGRKAHGRGAAWRGPLHGAERHGERGQRRHPCAVILFSAVLVWGRSGLSWCVVLASRVPFQPFSPSCYFHMTRVKVRTYVH